MARNPLMIYLPRPGGSGDGHLADVGLEHLTRNAPTRHWRDVINHGPDAAADGPGCGRLVTFGQMGAVDLESQVWRPAAADLERELPAGRYWVGLPKLPDGIKLRPEDLARPGQHPGEWAELDDGQAWSIPVAHKLPGEVHLGPGGKLEHEVRAEWAGYCERSAELFDVYAQMGKADQVDERTEKAWQLAAEGLRINYLLTPELIEHLGLLRHIETIFWAAGATFELRKLQAIEEQARKKNRSPIPAT